MELSLYYCHTIVTSLVVALVFRSVEVSNQSAFSSSHFKAATR